MFPPTQWTLVLNAGSGSAEAALDQLCQTYRPPLYTYLRRSGEDQPDAEDLVQGFLARLLGRKDLAGISADKGRFRTFLLTSLRNYVINQAEHDRAAKRGGGAVPSSLDAGNAEALGVADRSVETPERAFDRHWAQIVLGGAYERLRNEQQARGHGPVFEVLSPFLEGADPGEFEEVAHRLGMRRQTVAVTVHRLRQRLRELFLAEVAETVGPGMDPNVEVQHLFAALSES